MFPNVYVPATARHGVHIHSALPLSIVIIFPLPPSGKKMQRKKSEALLLVPMILLLQATEAAGIWHSVPGSTKQLFYLDKPVDW